MNWNDCEMIWKRQPLPTGDKADPAALRKSFEEKHRKMAAALFFRDVAEGGAALFVAAVIGFLWWRTGQHGWPFSLALLLVLGVGSVFARERFRARQRRLGPDATLLTKIEADIAELKHQRHLLLTMRTWYLGPVFASMLVVSLVLTIRSEPWSALRTVWFQSLFIGGYAALGVFAWLINRREVQRRIDPRIAELEKLRADLLVTG